MTEDKIKGLLTKLEARENQLIAEYNQVRGGIAALKSLLEKDEKDPEKVQQERPKRNNKDAAK